MALCVSAAFKFLLTPLREGRLEMIAGMGMAVDFYSRPCGRGDLISVRLCITSSQKFLLTPLREGRLSCIGSGNHADHYFYSRPCGRGDADRPHFRVYRDYFYSRPCGRGDMKFRFYLFLFLIRFLLTPLREGRRCRADHLPQVRHISTHAPAGGATTWARISSVVW